MSNKFKKTAAAAARVLGGKGFYIALALCLAVIGVSGYYLYASINSVTVTPESGVTETVIDPYLTDGETARADGPAPVEITFEEPVATAGDAEISVREDTGEEPAAAITPVQPEPDREPAPVRSVFVWPVSGTVIAAFSGEELVYNETMGDWRSHDGVDVSAQLGEIVRSVAAGTVTALYADPLYGTCVAVDHGSGLTSTYCGLQALPAVSVGDYVAAGDTLGAVGTTAIAESGEVPHLHLTMKLGGIAVDPTDYLP